MKHVCAGNSMGFASEMDVNRDSWNKRTPVHAASRAYDLPAFKEGACSLRDTDRAEVGNVAGKRLLHLQCHFGMDTLSWARLGAEVTGVDFSEEAVSLAKGLAGELDIPARFLRCNVYDLPDRLTGEFDIVFTTEGVLCWLPDLPRWAEIAAGFLKPGGTFYIREFHPLMTVFDYAASEPRVREPYFHRDEPMRFEGTDTYTDGELAEPIVSYEWVHSLGDLVTALADAGLHIEFLHEFPYCTFPALRFLTQSEDGLWRYEEAPETIPLMYSIRAHKACKKSPRLPRASGPCNPGTPLPAMAYRCRGRPTRERGRRSS